MKKFIYIGIVALCIIVIALFINKSSNKKPNDNNSNEKSNTGNKETGVVTNENDYKFESFEMLLEENNIPYDNKTEIFSDELNESGYSYNLGDETIEVYPIDYLKLENILLANKNDNEVIVSSMDGDEIEGIYINEMLILNCNIHKNDLLKNYK